jgi:hypothetical protein
MPALTLLEIEAELAKAGPHCPGCQCREPATAFAPRQDGPGPRRTVNASREW